MPGIPESLIAAIKSKEAVLFVGSGLSVAAGLPSAKELTLALAKKLNPSQMEWNLPPLQEVTETFVAKFDQKSLAAEVKKYIRTVGIGDLSPAHFLSGSGSSLSAQPDP